MRSVRLYHAAFVGFLTLYWALSALNNQTFYTGIFALFVGIYWLLVVGMYKNWPFAWRFAFVPPLIVALRMGYFFVYAVYVFTNNEERIRDSPGGVLVVAIACLLTLPPAISLTRLSLKHRNYIPAVGQEESS